VNLADYYRRLGLSVRLDPLAPPDTRLAADLLQGPAEFNLNGARWRDDWLDQSSGYRCWAVTVTDRFGDYGAAGLCVVRADRDALVVEAFTLNCRVLGKQVETTVLKRLAERAGAEGRPALELRYAPTPRNAVMRHFLARAASAAPAQGPVRLSLATVAALPLLGEAADAGKNADAPVTSRSYRQADPPPGGLGPDPRTDPSLPSRMVRDLGTGGQIAAAVRAWLNVTTRPRPQAGPDTPHPAAPSELAATISRIWGEVLDTPDVGPDENFFDLGGHSIAAVRTCGRLREELPNDVALLDLYRYPTVRALARYLSGGTDTPGAPAPRPQPATYPTSDGREPIAVVGMACRVPGAADPGEFWRLVRDGRSGLTTLTDADLAGPEDGNGPTTVPTFGWLADLDRFDAEFFCMTRREAEITDPQQRVFLECAWHALEDAGLPPRRFSGRIGIFAGSGSNDYLSWLLSDDGLVQAVGQAGLRLATAKDYLATRAAYRLDLRGPAVTVQTACSSSLVAVHMAVRALRAGECDLALAGGVSVTDLVPHGYRYEPGGIFSPDGVCRAFSEDADGTVPGNGVALVVLRRLGEAQRGSDRVRAVIRGSAVNNDGAVKAGFTAPSIQGQADVISGALADAAVPATAVSYVEAHGTGTQLGDVIELAALTETYGASGAPLLIGSVKPNIGHLDAAAGAAGLIKAVLALEHGQIPPSTNVSKPAHAADPAAAAIRLNTTLADWPLPEGEPRRAGVSSFGIGGTNAHVILEQAPDTDRPAYPPRPDLVVASAVDRDGLREAVRRLSTWAGENRGAELTDVAATTRLGRQAFRHRAALACGSVSELAEMSDLARWKAGEAAEGRPVIFVFPGQGAQWAGMAAELYRAEPVFREHVDAGLDALAARTAAPLRDALLTGEHPDALRPAELAQPAVFITDYALARLWLHWGVRPAALVGHSVGEFVCAAVAGALSVTDALTLVAERGRLTGQLPPGAMMAVGCGAEELWQLAPSGLTGPLDVAAVNGPKRCVIAGPEAAVEALVKWLTENRITGRRLVASHAFHSRQMAPAVAGIRALFATVAARPGGIPIASTVTGDWLTQEQLASASHWADQIGRTVRFADAVTTVAASHPGAIWLECGPATGLAALARQLDSGGHGIATLAGPGPGASLRQVGTAAGHLWCLGAPVDWAALADGKVWRTMPLPGYPFRRDRYLRTPPPERGGPGQEQAAGPVPAREPAEPPPRAAGPARPAMTGLARVVALIWEELFGTAAVGDDDNFFDLGGDSLSGGRYALRVAEVLGAEIPARAVFDHPTVAGQAGLIEQTLRASLPADEFETIMQELQAPGGTGNVEGR
jgi:acyl transferase domain-containing protein/acyl carrier protein